MFIHKFTGRTEREHALAMSVQECWASFQIQRVTQHFVRGFYKETLLKYQSDGHPIFKREPGRKRQTEDMSHMLSVT